MFLVAGILGLAIDVLGLLLRRWLLIGVIAAGAYFYYGGEEPVWLKSLMTALAPLAAELEPIFEKIETMLAEAAPGLAAAGAQALSALRNLL